MTIMLAITDFSFAQKITTETFRVSGECGMCKKKIEKAAKEAGVTAAVWNQQTKMLKVTYNVSAASTSSIQQKIANAGYDTPQYKTTDEAYNALDKCCQYERESATKASCCDNDKCGKEENCCAGMDCGKDGKCSMDKKMEKGGMNHGMDRKMGKAGMSHSKTVDMPAMGCCNHATCGMKS